MSNIALFYGGRVADDQKVWTVYALFEAEEMVEEFDVIAPARTSLIAIRAFVQAVVDRDYMPGGRIIRVDPFVGLTFH